MQAIRWLAWLARMPPPRPLLRQGTMIAITGDTLSLRYVIKDYECRRSTFWHEAVRIAQFSRRDGRSGPDILREASL
jgi:hypothetical protein